MKLGIGNLNSIAIRKAPIDTSEMISQLLFGETFKIIETSEKWIKITTDFDQYDGWVLLNQVLLLNEERYGRIIENNATVSKELITYISDHKNNLQIISLGASLPQFEKNSFKLLNEVFDFDRHSHHQFDMFPSANFGASAYCRLG